eukprot:6531167-Pyramimonas_sp.AAC.1
MATVLMVMTGLSRAAVIYPISALANKCRPRFMNIPIHYQHMLFYGGLIRGSVTVALAYHELGASVDENGVPDEVENDSARVGSPPPPHKITRYVQQELIGRS